MSDQKQSPLNIKRFVSGANGVYVKESSLKVLSGLLLQDLAKSAVESVNVLTQSESSLLIKPKSYDPKSPDKMQNLIQEEVDKVLTKINTRVAKLKGQ